MKHVKALKYLLVLTLPVTAAVSFTHTGWLAYLPILYAFGFIPALELFFPADAKNISETERGLRTKNALYDWVLYLIVPMQYVFLIWFFFAISDETLTITDKLGRTLGMGLLCGVLGINVAHELGHRVTRHEQFLAKMLLLTSQYTHFFIEHNRGHHKNVGTPEDPSSARYNEWLPAFWLRSVSLSYISAWRIENQRLRRKNLNPISLKNEMLQFVVMQAALLVGVGATFGIAVLLWYMLAATVGFLLLETVNYIEHYGLTRNKVSEFRYENTQPQHSWNSDHVLGRLLLFELSRHSDHHYLPNKKYQLLDHHDNSPQMPTGYPGMMLLAAVPPLWFLVMNKRIKL